MAARLAAAGHDVCVLERGREWPVGSFPDRGKTVTAALRSPKNPLGLYEFCTGDDVDVFVGSGLGGTSLINANVVIRPSPEAFTHPSWPAAVRAAASAGALSSHFDTVREMLAAVPARPPGPPLAKTEAHRDSARAAAQSTPAEDASDAPPAPRFKILDVAVNFDRYDDEPNHVGVHQKRCTLCGDCITGCNVGAKNTLASNYLPVAKQHQAAIFTCMEVDFAVRAPEGGYHLFVRHHPEAGGSPIARHLHARVVVVAAGVMGTAGILLRSRLRGLPLPAQLGHRVSANGDVLGFGYNSDRRLETMGFGTRAPDTGEPRRVGPTITSMVDYRDDHERAFIVEEGAFPSALVTASRKGLPKLALAYGDDTDHGLRDLAGEIARVVRDAARTDPKGALNHSMVYLGMGHDGADGRIILSHNGAARLLWGALNTRPVFQGLKAAIRDLTSALGGTYVPNPRSTQLLRENEITVHPLGGCPMGESREQGVVDASGRVFDPRADDPTATHDDLIVADASVIPTSLGVNPMLTVGALAEHIAADFQRHHPAPIGAHDGPLEAPVYEQPKPGIEFTENMRGYITREVTDAETPADYQRAADIARERPDGHFHVSLTIYTDDLAGFLDDPNHQAIAEGYVDSGLFGSRNRADHGVFQLFAPGRPRPRADGECDDDSADTDTEASTDSHASTDTTIDQSHAEVDTSSANDSDPIADHKEMRYYLAFYGADGAPYLLDGYKVIRDDERFDVWSDSTTLYTSIRAGWSPDGPVVAQGVLRVLLDDFLAQLTTFRIRHVDSHSQAARWYARFGLFFFGTLWGTYIAPSLESLSDALSSTRTQNE